MRNLIDLYLLGHKGLSVLEAIIEHDFKEMISCVIVGRDKYILDDCQSSIISICEKHCISYVERANSTSKL